MRPAAINALTVGRLGKGAGGRAWPGRPAETDYGVALFDFAFAAVSLAVVEALDPLAVAAVFEAVPVALLWPCL